MLGIIERLFADQFEPWRVVLPRRAFLDLGPGCIEQAGWLIQYCWGRDESGTYLDYYASHRMTEDIHERIYGGGRRVALPSIVGLHPSSADPEEAVRLSEAHFARNREVLELIRAKHFTKVTTNMMLRCGFQMPLILDG